MKEFFKKIEDFLQVSKDPQVRLPANIDSILDEANSSWSFNIEIENTTDSVKEVAILTGAISSDRFQVIDASHNYKSINGENILTPYAEGTIINLKDNPRLIKKIVGTEVHAVASQEHHNGANENALIKQVVYKDATGQISVTSKTYFLNFFKDFIKTASTRIWQMHVSTDNPEIFNGKITKQELNPYTQEAKELIELEHYFSDSNIEAQKVIIDKTLHLTEETYLAVTIPTNTKVSYGFRASAYLSNGNAINQRFKVSGLVGALKKLSNKPTKHKTEATETSFSASK